MASYGRGPYTSEKSLQVKCGSNVTAKTNGWTDTTDRSTSPAIARSVIPQD